jgi:hypothetical protein
MHSRLFRCTSLLALLCAVVLPSHAADQAKGFNVPTPVADYDFLGWLGDALGNGPDLAPIGEVASTYSVVTADGNTRLVLAVPEGAGLRLDSGPLLDLEAYSIAMIVSVASTSSYAKLIDTNALADDSGVYAQSNDLRYYTAGSANGSDSFPDATLRQVVVTRAQGGAYTGYLNGVQQFSFTDADNLELTRISAERILHFLRDDNMTGNSEESDAVVHRIRLFDRTLAGPEVLLLEPNRGQLISLFRVGGFESVP